MKALILNSGTGSRMGELTSTKPKCMTDLVTGETILSRQLRQIAETRIIKEVIITTGLYDDVIREYCNSLNLDLTYHFVKNELYNKTNYIYSVYLAGNLTECDLLFLHGDLVFDSIVLNNILKQKESYMVVSAIISPLPEKDFKAVIKNGKIEKIGIEFFDNAVAAQPLYKLNQTDWLIWFSNINKYCETNNTGCYAENAFNTLEKPFNLFPYDSGELLCSEIDNIDDLANVNLVLERSY